MSSMFINEIEIKSRRKLLDVIENNNILSIKNIEFLNTLYKINLTIDQLKEFLFLLKLEDNKKYLYKYIIKCDIDTFDKNRYYEYKNFIINNPNCSSVTKIWKIIYGDKYEEKLKIKSDKFISPYMIEFWFNKGFNKDEALIKIKEYKSKKVTSLFGFIERHGETKGLDMYTKFQESSKHTLEKYIFKYGLIEGDKKWKSYLKTKDSNSYNWAISKTNGNINEAEELLVERKKSTTIDLNKCISKYGAEKGNEIYIEICKSRDSSSINYYNKKSGGNLEKAKELYKIGNKTKDCNSFDFFLKEADGNIDKAKELFNKNVILRRVNSSKASKESLKLLKPLYNRLIELNFKKEDLFLGIEDSTEYYLISRDKKIYFYDFTIKSLKIIVEYHGYKWHPNIEKYTYEELKENFKQPYKKNLDIVLEEDKLKNETINYNGFEVLILWSDDELELNQKKINNFFTDKGIDLNL